MENNLYVLLTVFIPVFAAVFNLFLARFNRAQRWVGLGSGLLTWGASLILLGQVIASGPQIYRVGVAAPPYGIVFVVDLLGGLFGVMVTTVMLAGLMYLVHSHEKSVDFPAFMPLFLLMQVGLNGTIFTGDLFTFFVFLEIMVLTSVAMVAVSDNPLGLEAAIKYVFISGMGSLFLLLGIMSLYTTFGTLNLAHMAQLLASGERPLLATGAAIMLVSAFLLKSAVFPFHFWQPDFHTTAPTAVSAMLSSVIVKVGIYGIIRVVTLLFIEEAAAFQQLLLLLGVVGLFFGGFAALRTYNGKRMLAYSTIAQVGFIRVAIGWGIAGIRDGNPIILAAAIIYAFNHAFIKSSLLMIMGVVSSYNKKHSVDFEDIKGSGNKTPPLVGMLWFVGSMSLAGIPPLNGFISKLSIVRSGTALAQWLPLGLAVASGALTLLYMFRTWQNVFQYQKKDLTLQVLKKGDGILAPAFLIALCILLGIYARPLIVLAELTAIQLADPLIYIGSVGLFSGG